jgi:hypothetical protein
MLPLPPVTEIQQRQDREHLKLLAIFHFVVAGFAFLGIGFVFLHYALFHSFLSDPEIWKAAQKGANPPPRELFAKFADILIWFYVFFGAVLVTGGILNLLSGLFLLRRKHRIFSIVIAAFDCLQVPFGTILGVFTIIVLSRDSVQKLYDG